MSTLLLPSYGIAPTGPHFEAPAFLNVAAVAHPAMQEPRHQLWDAVKNHDTSCGMRSRTTCPRHINGCVDCRAVERECATTSSCNGNTQLNRAAMSVVLLQQRGGEAHSPRSIAIPHHHMYAFSHRLCRVPFRIPLVTATPVLTPHWQTKDALGCGRIRF